MIGVFIPVDDKPHRLPQGWVIQENGCWDWVGALSPEGYATGRAHRVSYERFVGPIPDGLTIDHLCRNRRCGNPDHMEAVTNRVNVLRGIGPTARHARQTHCKYGHPFSPENTYWRTNGARRCRHCQRVYLKEYKLTWRKGVTT